mmetsp:Transcript_10686/g.16337  ORF Transcript_10686/g.16337 Transcript_10686/m.16337 type:complete len:102 (+) Transcript_10686:530-835(+)
MSGNTKNRMYILNELFRALGVQTIPKNKMRQKRPTMADMADQIIHMSLASSCEGPATKRSYRVDVEFSSEASNLERRNLSLSDFIIIWVDKFYPMQRCRVL